MFCFGTASSGIASTFGLLRYRVRSLFGNSQKITNSSKEKDEEGSAVTNGGFALAYRRVDFRHTPFSEYTDCFYFCLVFSQFFFNSSREGGDICSFVGKS